VNNFFIESHMTGRRVLGALIMSIGEMLNGNSLAYDSYHPS